MRVGVFTPLLSQLPLAAVLKKLKSLQIDTVELGTGNYPGDAHCKLAMLEDATALADFQRIITDHGATISALSCHGNALHPDKSRAQHDREVSRKTILLAEKLGIPVVVDFSGCPGDSPSATAPNWVTCPWPPDYLKVLEWQWNEVVAPYWTEHAKFAADHGVKIAIEMHPGFVVYSPETMLRLRSIAGPGVGCNFDPSHLFWQSIDPIAAVRVLKEAIFHVHAKDTQIYTANLPRTGVLDTKPYTQERERGW
ncbi:MAG: sugar phosphate isomerase/epimerase, partial [Candidatus Sulfotelmatobacter sp.]